jgi:CRP/FNR family transcriptional regulator, cyclic AMP receptor protein
LPRRAVQDGQGTLNLHPTMKREHDQAIIDAIASSSFRGLPRDVVDRLTEGSALRTVAAGTTMHQEGDPAFVELVVSGLIRGYVSGPDGRTMTIRYCRPGALMGTATLFNKSRPRAHGNLTALIDSRVLVLFPATVRALADRDIRVVRALLHETSARVAEYISEIEANSFTTLRQRLARHLLDLAAEQQVGAQLVARTSQDELAGAIGTVREIVVRILHDMRNEDLVRTSRGRVELLDARRLDSETYSHQRAPL